MLIDNIFALTITSGLIGVCIGSFLNVVIHRLPKMMEAEWATQCAELRGELASVDAKQPLTLSQPRSRCPHCGHQIRAYENIPLISYFLILRGKCSGCGQGISLRYPIVEAFTGLLSAFVAWHFGPTSACIGALLLIWGLIALTGIEIGRAHV